MLTAALALIAALCAAVALVRADGRSVAETLQHRADWQGFSDSHHGSKQ